MVISPSFPQTLFFQSEIERSELQKVLFDVENWQKLDKTIENLTFSKGFISNKEFITKKQELKIKFFKVPELKFQIEETEVFNYSLSYPQDHKLYLQAQTIFGSIKLTFVIFSNVFFGGNQSLTNLECSFETQTWSPLINFFYGNLINTINQLLLKVLDKAKENQQKRIKEDLNKDILRILPQLTQPQLTQKQKYLHRDENDTRETHFCLGEMLNQKVYLEINARYRHIFLLGEGSEQYLEQLFLQDIKLGYGACLLGDCDNLHILDKIPEHRRCDLVIFTDSQIEHKFNIFDSSILGINPNGFLRSNSLAYLLVESLKIKEIQKSTLLDFLTYSGRLVMYTWQEGNTLLDFKKILEDQTIANFRLSKCTDLETRKNWNKANEEIRNNPELQSFLQQILVDLDLILQEKIAQELLLSPQSTFDLRQIMDNNKILIISLTKTSQKTAEFITKMLIYDISIQGMARGDALSYNFDGSTTQINPQKRQPFFVHIKNKNAENYPSDMYAEALEEIRMYRVGFCLQSSQIIESKILHNCINKLIFPCSFSDAESLAVEFAPLKKTEIAKPNYGTFNCRILSQGDRLRPLNVNLIKL